MFKEKYHDSFSCRASVAASLTLGHCSSVICKIKQFGLVLVLTRVQGSGIQGRYTVRELDSLLEHGGLQKYKAESFVPIYDNHRSRGVKGINDKGCI